MNNTDFHNRFHPQQAALTFEQRVEDRIERQIKLAEESNRIMERMAKVLEDLVPRMKLSGNR